MLLKEAISVQNKRSDKTMVIIIIIIIIIIMIMISNSNDNNNKKNSSYKWLTKNMIIFHLSQIYMVLHKTA